MSRSSAVRWGTKLQAGRSRVRFPMGWLILLLLLLFFNLSNPFDPYYGPGVENWRTSKKPAPVPLCVAWIPHNLQGHRGGELVTNRLSYGTELRFVILETHSCRNDMTFRFKQTNMGNFILDLIKENPVHAVKPPRPWGASQLQTPSKAEELWFVCGVRGVIAYINRAAVGVLILNI
jgi:hypothetical protein